ncbi:DUF4192 domain-containing protein [Streptomyces sp. NPDC047002]|uniref:DUF4192 domain-containing protein n=1 Tax=Streptomyces sp. NPDC047002 TaxID=3155475 RepID=UPI00345650EE
MSKHQHTSGPAGEQPITLRGPAELVDALPYILGFRPTDSVVVITLHGRQARFGSRLRLGIPADTEGWQAAADHAVAHAVEAAGRRRARPDGVLLFLWRDPDTAAGETGRQVMERLRPLAELLRTACGTRDLPVMEALCVSGGRFWSYCCEDPRCCPPDGGEAMLPGTSVIAAHAAYAGLRVRGSIEELEARITPRSRTCPEAQARAFDRAGGTAVPEILGGGREAVADRTLSLARDLIRRLATVQGPPPAVPGGEPAAEAAADALDDALLQDAEVAAVVVGLQDRDTRDRAAAWTDDPQAGAALRLWRALARRCSGVYVEYGAAPLALAGWYAWAAGDEPSARAAVSRALAVDPDYQLARLLNEAYDRGVDTAALRSCFDPAPAREPGPGDPDPGVRQPGGSRPWRFPRPRRPRSPEEIVRDGMAAARRTLTAVSQIEWLVEEPDLPGAAPFPFPFPSREDRAPADGGAAAHAPGPAPASPSPEVAPPARPALPDGRDTPVPATPPALPAGPAAPASDASAPAADSPAPAAPVRSGRRGLLRRTRPGPSRPPGRNAQAGPAGRAAEGAARRRPRLRGGPDGAGSAR